MINSKFKWAALVMIAVTTLVACSGGNNNQPSNPVASNLSVPLTAANAAAVSGKAFSFPGAVPALGTTAATTVTITGSTFSIGSGGGTATGNMTYASCIFTVLTSSIPTIAVGQVITVNPCTLNVATQGLKSDLSAQNANATLLLGAVLSGAVTVSVTVSPGGAVTVGGISVGSVTLSTGATGSGS